MTETTSIDLAPIARDLNLPLPGVQRIVELLDEGNTVPFITRFRKDETGGLDEEQIRELQARLGKARQLAERKATILKSIEAQGKLLPELAEQIKHANTSKRLEDLYLPYKPKKQTLATIARERGLEPLAVEIFEADPQAADLSARAAIFLAASAELKSVDEVLAGVGHLIAERMSEYSDLRGKLRKIFQKTGKIVCTKVETPVPVPAAAEAPKEVAEGEPEEKIEGEIGRGGEEEIEQAAQNEPMAAVEVAVMDTRGEASLSASLSPAPEATPAAEPETPSPTPPLETPPDSSSPTAEEAAPPPVADSLPAGRLFEAPAVPVPAPLAAVLKKKKKKKKKVIGEHAFKDYYNYTEPLSRVPPHRVLAINRGERAHAIRVKIEADSDAMQREAEQLLIRPDHPHAEFLKGCIRDSLARLILPSLERELRREISEKAEEHAVEVFVRNLRKLLLQPPTRGRRVLAIDPGFKSGSKMAALDEFGNVLGHGMVFVIGKDEERRKKSRSRLADMVKQYNVSVIAIGNGTGCRETEQLVADCLAEELKDRDVAYVVVNEAGASIYSTSPLGREELPQFDALQRGAISIGRRLLDPLSEMVKINPANLGVGLYQHDIKAKHLKESLDAVVESAVNFVGVDVNSASPALLRYVSGMNALTARRVYEYRREKGPFKNREELKLVPGFGEQTYVQAAGFLKVIGSEDPLDATFIHPESYGIARQVLAKLGLGVEELAKSVPAPIKKEEKKEFAAELVSSPLPVVSGEEAEVGGQKSEVTSEEPAAQNEEPGTSSQEPVATPAAEPTSPQSEIQNLKSEIPPSPPLPLSESPPLEPPIDSAPPEPVPPARNVIADRANEVNVPALAAELGVGVHLLDDILMALARAGVDPRDTLAAPVLRRGILKLEDLAAGMELAGTVLNVVDFGVFVDIGLSDSGLVHISRLADRFIKDPHEVVGVGDVLKVWVVEVDKNRRRVSLTAIAPGSERSPHPPRERAPKQPRPPRPPRPQGDRPPRPQAAGAVPAASGPPQQGQRPPRPPGGGGGGGRRDQRRERRPETPTTIERAPTKPKKIKPLTKAQEDGKEPMRSFSDLIQLLDKKKPKPPPPPASTDGEPPAS
ncbi:MAG: Tex-like N-terminal domain-containing protein, partial [Pirellulaceae bacterium]|nr:Tex-like N-terminal domain-containing protein [Pirellulaceae bacterium]